MLRNSKKNGMERDVFVVFIEIKAHPRTMIELLERFDNLEHNRLADIITELQETHQIYKADKLYVCKV